MSYHPYQPPSSVLVTTETQSVPGFLKGWIIADIIFCSLRIVIVPLSIIGAFSIEPNNALRDAAITEIMTHTGILLFGISGNIFILRKKKLGIYLSSIALIFAAFQILGSVNKIHSQSTAFINETQKNFFLASGAITVLIRLITNSFYIFSLYKYIKNRYLN